MSNIVLVEVKTGVTAIEQITDPSVLSDLMDQWQNIKAIGAALEKKIKTIIGESSECGNYYFAEKPGTREFIDDEAAIALASGIIKEDRISACRKLNLTELEDAFIEAAQLRTGCTKKEAKDEFASRFAPVVVQKTKKELTRHKAGLQETLNAAAIDPRF